MGISLIDKVLKRFKFSDRLESGESVVGEENVFNSYNLTRKVPASSPPCLAPWTSVNFNIDGYANVCCLNKKTSVSVANNSIDDIWKSEAFNLLRENVSQNKLQHDCSVCHDQIHSKNFSGVKAVNYDSFYPYNPERPKIMEFCLENTCNLACVMCNSLLSSSIRKNENLPPLKKQYDEKFVTELEPYIPFLKEAVFSGGEPFLIPIYFKIWEKMLAINPEIIISVVTNGTTLNDKIKAMMERGRFRINVSIDSVHKETYELIRRNSNFEIVMENFEWFREYGNRKNLPVNIPVCPLTVNWSRIPEVVRFANEKNVSINFVYVDRPFTLALTYSKPEYLQTIIEQYNLEKFDTTSPRSDDNIKRFKGLIDDIESWRKNSIHSSEEIHIEGDLMQRLETKIMNSGELKRDDVKKEMILKIKDMLTEIPADRTDSVLKVINNYSPERIHHFLDGKNTKEIAVFFKEFAGK